MDHRMRNVAAMTTGESMVTVESPTEPTTEKPKFVKTLQDTIRIAIDRLPLVPGVLELVGIGPLSTLLVSTDSRTVDTPCVDMLSNPSTPHVSSTTPNDINSLDGKSTHMLSSAQSNIDNLGVVQ
ncbi:hypothetical protein QJS10_CPA10g00790 [Acorus calamus]|uniref:Uncharacterized protein n=1 Tax=Acorus calamus TaxID=4465 RepID=A0AAV9E153_ACOCL|nr:hypothetical protein QJS10_CPA10g00790 [Acorus calamus]